MCRDTLGLVFVVVVVGTVVVVVLVVVVMVVPSVVATVDLPPIAFVDEPRRIFRGNLGRRSLASNAARVVIQKCWAVSSKLRLLNNKVF